MSTFILVFRVDLAVFSGGTTRPLSFTISVGFESRLRDRLAAFTGTGTAMAAMPGYGFSGKPTTPGWDPAHIARLTFGKENGTNIEIYCKDWGSGQPIVP